MEGLKKAFTCLIVAYLAPMILLLNDAISQTET